MVKWTSAVNGLLGLLVFSGLSPGCYRILGTDDDSADGAAQLEDTETGTESELDTDADSASDGDADSETDTDSASDGDGDTDEQNSECVSNANCTQPFCDQIRLPAGTYPRGSPVEPLHPDVDPGCVTYGFGQETPLHHASLDTFCIDKYEVTDQRYMACVNAGACPTNIIINCPAHDARPQKSQYLPMSMATPEGALAYCRWVGRDLCTEAQWERAANGPGPTQRKYPWGDEPPQSTWLGFFDNEMIEVDRYPKEAATPEGVYGLAGNVMELVLDYYAPYDVQAGQTVKNPVGPDSGNYVIARGGAVGVSTDYKNTERIVIDEATTSEEFDEW